MRNQRMPGNSTRLPGGIRLLLGLLCAVMLLAILGGCSLATERQKQLYDDEAELAQEGDTFTYVKRVGDTSNESNTVSFSSFYGMETIWFIHASAKGKVNFIHQQEIDGGRFKLVAIGPDREVTTLAEGTSEGKMELKVSPGTYRIKFVGNNAKGRVKTEIQADAGIRIVAADH
ncbi:hypothetical protein D3C76_215650 [compost metagenome]|jgi:hypothetical protein|uniref:hypothetical protein n=1 Tax=Paenibacillus sp. J53TS2 TaxID=2807197 RepID=UPI000FB2C89C|nr:MULTISPECIES: hypothetical protein [Paenibacillus]MUG86728.1 hypothetical protein [Paenibacillus timonensis]GIP49688.1 hypothetical protein J53TS2_32790 [Paenibacillus sp. J53TS2]